MIRKIRGNRGWGGINGLQVLGWPHGGWERSRAPAAGVLRAQGIAWSIHELVHEPDAVSFPFHRGRNRSTQELVGSCGPGPLRGCYSLRSGAACWPGETDPGGAGRGDTERSQGAPGASTWGRGIPRTRLTVRTEVTASQRQEPRGRAGSCGAPRPAGTLQGAAPRAWPPS